MGKKNFLLMSLEDTKIKKISNVISNDSCRKILDFLSEKDATESEIAKKLNIPISTVNYNLKQLVDTGLIESTEFHYSEKGKEVAHYRIANKYIIIAPKSTYGIKERLKGILPIALISAGAAGIIQLVNRYAAQPKPEAFSAMKAEGLRIASEESADIMMTMQAEAPAASQAIPNIALWFLAGAIFALLVYFIAGIIRKKID